MHAYFIAAANNKGEFCILALAAVETALNLEHKVGGIVLKVERCPQKRKINIDEVRWLVLMFHIHCV